MDNNPLYQQCYSGDLERSAFSEILGCLDHVTPCFINRSEYIQKQGEKLVETGEDKFGKQYDLFLPEDLQYIELLPFIDMLNQKFDIEKYAKFDELLVATKMAIIYLLREEGGEKELQEYITKSGVSKRLQAKIANVNLLKSYSQSVAIMHQFPPDVHTEGSLAKIYIQGFEKTFLARGVDLLRGNSKNFTQKDAEGLKGKKGKIGQRVDKSELDEEERLLRDMIGIDEYIELLNEARKAGNDEVTHNLEIEICTIILNELQKYPYQNTEGKYGYSPSQILITKEMQCLGFSFVVHAFLQELGIQHSAIISPSHISIGVHIGNYHYSLDAAGYVKDLQEYSISGTDIKRDGEVYETHNGEIYEQEITNGLLSSLYYNLSNFYRNSNRQQIFMDKSDFYDDLSLGNLNKQIDECYRNNDIEGWIEICDDFLSVYPENISIQISKAQALDISGRRDEARSLLWSVMWEDPKNPLPYKYLSDIAADEQNIGISQIFEYLSIYCTQRNTHVSVTTEIAIIQGYLKRERYIELYKYLQELREEDIINLCLL